MMRRMFRRRYALISLLLAAGQLWAADQPLPKVRIARDGRSFETDAGKPFVPFGVSYFRPGTGWAPQVWKQFDAEATRKDFARMRELGINCVRVFLSYGSFYSEPGVLKEEGLGKFDQFLSLAEQAGIYVHPTGPDNWEGPPNWHPYVVGDPRTLQYTEQFWKLFAARYRETIRVRREAGRRLGRHQPASVGQDRRPATPQRVAQSRVARLPVLPRRSGR